MQSLAIAAGCAGLGVAGVDVFADAATAIAERRDQGLAGRVRFTYKDPATATNVRRSFPWAERLVVLSWPYLPAAGNPGSATSSSGRIARFAVTDHYAGLRAALGDIAAVLRSNGYRAEVLADDDRLVDRAAAVRAGIGWWGKSTMVLDPRHGPWLLLGSVVTDADLEVSEPMVRDCGTCDACIPACPTGAIVAPGVLDASRCLAHWTQTPGPIPVELRVPMADRIYGCDDCLEACPPGVKRMTEAHNGTGRVDLEELLAADDATLLERHHHLYIPGRNPKYLRRNALVALGNTVAAADDEAVRARAVGVLAGYLGSRSEVYRSHAAWALGRIGGDDSAALLRHQLARERSPQVQAELAAAMTAAAAPQ